MKKLVMIAVILALSSMTVFAMSGAKVKVLDMPEQVAAGFMEDQATLDMELDLFADVRADALTPEEALAVEGEGAIGYAIGYSLGIGISSVGGGVLGGLLYTATAYALFPTTANLNEAFGYGYVLGSFIGASVGVASFGPALGTVVSGFIRW